MQSTKRRVTTNKYPEKKKARWDKIDVLRSDFDESKYPSWVFKRKENALVKYLLEGESDEEELKKQQI